MTLRKKDDYFDDILKEFTPLFEEAIKIEMQVGNNIAINDAKGKGKKTKDSGLTISKKDLQNFTDKFLVNVKDANRDISKRVTNAILENVSNKGSNIDLSKMIEDIFTKDSSTHFNYKNRYKTIARTESAGILNTSGMNKASKLGFNKKYISIVDDKRTSEVSKAMFRKYGGEDKAIAMDKEFVVTVNGKEYRGLTPPFMPNDRDFVLYTFE